MIHSDLPGWIQMFFKSCGQFETAYLAVRPRGLRLIYSVLLVNKPPDRKVILKSSYVWNKIVPKVNLKILFCE
jgi:hypothetical protein